MRCAARVLAELKALPFEDAFSVMVIVVRCVVERQWQERLWPNG
jgi:hypothetical protein